MGLILGLGARRQAVATPTVWLESLLPELSKQASCESHLECKDKEGMKGEKKKKKKKGIFMLTRSLAQGPILRQDIQLLRGE